MSENPGFTPGPWTWWAGSVTNWHEPTETGQYEMEWIPNTSEYPKKEADGRLIASAPALYWALKNCLALVILKYGNLDPDANKIIDQARAALEEITP